jgi:hypothetical protein
LSEEPSSTNLNLWRWYQFYKRLWMCPCVLFPSQGVFTLTRERICFCIISSSQCVYKMTFECVYLNSNHFLDDAVTSLDKHIRYLVFYTRWHFSVFTSLPTISLLMLCSWWLTTRTW